MATLDKNILYDGSPAPSAEVHMLRAGPVTVQYAGGDIRYVRLGSHEVLRRVYAAVRDYNWATIIPRIENQRIEQETDSFRVTFDATHQQRDIDFFWRGSIGGAADGTITFTFDGAARSTFRRNRIGFCVLHSDTCAGLPCSVKHTDGTIEDSQFPLYISPHQPIFNIRALTHEVAPSVYAEVLMEGDTFEMEDQRNWTDASYKTYCTPLSLPYPATIERGTKIIQSIMVRLHGEIPKAPLHEGEGFGVRVLQQGLRPSLTYTLTITDKAVPLPAIGLIATNHGMALTEREIERLRRLNLKHLRIDLRLNSSTWRADLQRAGAEARALSIGLEAAVFLSDLAETELTELVAALDEFKPLVERWLIFHMSEKSTSEKWVSMAREKLGDYGAPIGTGTDYFFTELNREHPPVDVADFIVYSLNPQVHAFDNIDLIETLPVQGATVESAKQFSAGKPVVVSPVTLKTRRNPNATGSQTESPADARQKSLFGAVWTLGSIKSLSEVGAHSMTYYEVTGERGVMQDSVFPMYQVFADVGEFAGGEVLVSHSSDPLAFDALVLHREGRTRVLLANYTRQSQTITLPDVYGTVSVKMLDETTAEHAMRSPETYRQAAGTQIEASADGLQVEIMPYGIVRVDISRAGQ